MEFMMMADRDRLTFLLLLAYAGHNSNKIPFCDRHISALCQFDPLDRDKGCDLNALIEAGLLEEWTEEKAQQAIDKEEQRREAARLRKARSRAKKQASQPTSHPPSQKASHSCHTHVTPGEVEKERELEKEKDQNTYGSSDDDSTVKPPSKPSTTPEYPDEFERLWAKKPPRKGGQPKRLAFRSFTARIKEGHTVEEIDAGIERYIDYLKADDKLNTQFVMQFTTFLGPEKHFLNAWEIPPPRPGDRAARNRAAVEAALNPEAGEVF
jgi:hypothetical protein